jgi:hypothetical protein
MVFLSVRRSASDRSTSTRAALDHAKTDISNLIGFIEPVRFGGPLDVSPNDTPVLRIGRERPQITLDSWRGGGGADQADIDTNDAGNVFGEGLLANEVSDSAKVVEIFIIDLRKLVDRVCFGDLPIADVDLRPGSVEVHRADFALDHVVGCERNNLRWHPQRLTGDHNMAEEGLERKVLCNKGDERGVFVPEELCAERPLCVLDREEE